ncbi:MAG: hypothetical protein WCP21_01070, partial [Armatimonadota bacterium]
LCLLAAYDPNGLVDFLDTIGGRPHGLDKLFATHPPGPDRVVATRQRVAELERSQYPQLVALAQSLQERHHLKRAAAVAASAMEYFPAEDAPRCLLSQLEQQRSSPENGQAVSLPDDLQTQAKTTLGDLRGDEQELYKAEQALRTRLGAFYADQQIATALQYAQVLSPELDEVAYVSTLARAYWVMSRAAQEAQRQGEVAARGASVRLGWERVAKELVANKVTVPVTANSLEAQRTELQRSGQVFVAEARPAVQATTAQVKASAARCGELTTASRMVAGALLALLASGREQPLGRLTYAHFILLQGDILAADQRIRRSEKASEAALHAILDQHLRVLQVALTATHATAGPALRELDLALTAARVGATPPELAAAATTQPFGEAVFALLEPRVQAKALAGLQVRDCLLRIAYLDVVAER